MKRFDVERQTVAVPIATTIVVINHLLQRRKDSIVHVWRSQRDVSKAWCLKSVLSLKERIGPHPKVTYTIDA